jgi:hypothetical protein
VVEVAESLARNAGHPASERALELVGETLRAAAGDPELRERVLHGRVEREQSGATLGTPPLGPSPKKRDPRSPKPREAAQARRELKRLGRELADAAAREERLLARVEEAAEALRREKKRLAESKRETADLKRRLSAAERKAKS